jgi:DNA-directed RNA polymerase specialized sigma24 family protein
MSVSARKPLSRLPRRITPEEFARELSPLRLRLLSYIARTRPCTEEDAEDLLQDTILYGLKGLQDYDADTGAAGLVAYLKAAANLIILRDRRATAHQPDTVPLVYGMAIIARPGEALAQAMRSSLRLLTPELSSVVSDYLDGYRQQDIARRNHIHRNTVANRMETAAQQLQCSFPSFPCALFDLRFFFECATHTRYTRQNDMARRWKNNHPAERRPLRREKSPEADEGVRPSLLRDLYCPDPFLTGAKRRADRAIRKAVVA